MKLRNKKTGEIKEVKPITIGGFRSLAELNAEWEDVTEESKEYWWIDTGRIPMVRKSNNPILSTAEDIDKEIGNYFGSEEEAKKAVEKLKAWRRLEDKGFRFNKWTIPEEPKTPHIKLIIEAEMDVPDSPYDLDICFGGVE